MAFEEDDDRLAIQEQEEFLAAEYEDFLDQSGLDRAWTDLELERAWADEAERLANETAARARMLGETLSEAA